MKNFRIAAGGISAIVAIVVLIALLTGDDASLGGGEAPPPEPPPPETTAPATEAPVPTDTPTTDSTGTPPTSTETPDPFATPTPIVGVPVTISRAVASGSAPNVTGAGGETITYGPELAIDGRNDTAWCVPGPGLGEFITVKFNQPVSVTRIEILPGYDKIDGYTGQDRFEENRKITDVTYGLRGAVYGDHFSGNLRRLNPLNLPEATSTKFIKIEPQATTEPTRPSGDYTCISEIAVEGAG
ncbi:MAG: discoidin domain-containing protein [Actinomycetota bacterium]